MSKRVANLLLATLLVGSCSRAVQTRVIVVREVVKDTPCVVPPLPQRAMIVGFPVDTPGGLALALTKSDGVEQRRELDGLRETLTALSACFAR